LPDIEYARVQCAGSKLLSEGKTIKIPVAGWSMWPTIRNGEVVVIKSADQINIIERESLRGRIILVESEKTGVKTSLWLIHRISRIDGGKIMTRGDNSFDQDPAKSSDEVAGIVTHVIRGDRTIPLKRRYGFLFKIQRYLWCFISHLYSKKPFN
jgi:hypothetical protein